MSLRPLNWQIAKSQSRACWHLQKTGLTHTCWHLQKTSITFQSDKDYFELGGFSICYVIATSEPADIQVWPFSPTRTTFELGGFSIGYVIATSEPADSQVSPFSPTRTTSSLVASQSVMSLRPLNRQIAKSHLSVRRGLFLCHYLTNFELGGFSIGYVIATSELADSQVSSFSPARIISLTLYDKFWAWWLLNRLRHCDLWTGRWPGLTF